MVAHALKYRGVIQEIGSMVPGFLQFLPYGMLILFDETAPAELRSLSLVHNGTQLVSDLAAGDYLKFSPPAASEQPQSYRLSMLGEKGMPATDAQEPGWYRANPNANDANPVSKQTDAQEPQWYRVTAVGESVNANLAKLGHVVIHFDGAAKANLPGAISVEPELEDIPTVGTYFEFFGLKE